MWSSKRACLRRYAIMQKGVQSDYSMPIKFLDGDTEFEGFTPRESIWKIIADKTSENGVVRTFRCQFNLKSLKRFRLFDKLL